MTRLIHFEMETRDPEKKMAFYERVFGWTFTAEGDYWLVKTGPDEKLGIDGAIMRGAEEESLRTINTISVADIDEFLVQIERAGGKVVTAKTEVPEVGKFAYCEDPEGLAFGIIQLNDEDQSCTYLDSKQE